jgi:hypothetical protein
MRPAAGMLAPSMTLAVHRSGRFGRSKAAVLLFLSNLGFFPNHPRRKKSESRPLGGFAFLVEAGTIQ